MAKTKAPSPNGTKPEVVQGFRRKHRWIRFTCELATLEPEDGCEPLWIEVPNSLTWEEIDTLRFTDDQTYADRWVLIAPYVRAWNAVGVDGVTGDLTPLPPPIEAGPEVFRALDRDICTWIDLTVQNAFRGDQKRPKETTPSDDTPTSPPDTNSA